MICDTFADETPATDRIVAGIKADGVEEFALMFAEEAIKDNNITTGWKARASRAASEYAEFLREGGGGQMSKPTYEELEAALKELRRIAFSARRNSHNCWPFQYSDLCEEIIDMTALIKEKT